MDKYIRPYPETPLDGRRVTPHLRDVRLKVLEDIDAFIRQREYGKASDLLLTMVCTGSLLMKDIWKPLLGVLRQQDPQNRSLSSILDVLIVGVSSMGPNDVAMEQFFAALESNYDDAYRIMLGFSSDLGSKLPAAHGYLGVLIACLRELELRQTLGKQNIPDHHVFKYSEFAQFVLTKEENQRTKYTLKNAQQHLEQALKQDKQSDFFVPYYVQVLIALDKYDEAVSVLQRRYAQEKSIHILRMLISLDPREPVDQVAYMLDYLEMDPYESRWFDKFISSQLDNLENVSVDILKRLLLIIINRIELGDTFESSKWKYLATIVKFLSHEHKDILNSTMDQRLQWWHTMYFDESTFRDAEITDRVVYTAVCAQQLVDLEPEDPIYKILCGDDLSEEQASFVNDHIV
ncbi:hypothetical protein IWW36_000253 [Coemansia brasiliensis]|uniref:Uncharacterized protein n=1 Tax=Coemansia brasiliensis TaxID=2650707 RepID=A0A9W8M1W6_9FUNG|nr:hypothetical protein IWW36_000253 [Coemansia brasiliensis]